ncbi:MAG: Hsp20/alpha crystallin family protein [Patescibacteria group bacterium]|mgnify:CR=1 FL=1
MFKNKKSFFERLTGSVSLNRDESPSTEELPEEPKNQTWIKESNEEGELAVDVYQTPNAIVVKTMIAGVRLEDLNVTITREMVTIKGKRDEEPGISNDDYFQQELYWGSFSRTILLPAEVEAEDAEATESHGLLTIVLPKIDKEKTKRLKIRTL